MTKRHDAVTLSFGERFPIAKFVGLTNYIGMQSTVRTILTLIGGPGAMARHVNERRVGATLTGKDVHNWGRRDSIPARYVNAVDEILADMGRHDLIEALEVDRFASAHSDIEAA